MEVLDPMLLPNLAAPVTVDVWKGHRELTGHARK
jgi:hypothetical protein